MSWGGTMFEYLMPQLLLRGYPGTLLDQSCRASVRRQIEYGKDRSVPWGMSESAYAFTDRVGQLSVQGVRRSGPWAQAGPRRRPRRLTLRHRACGSHRSSGGGVELHALDRDWALTAGLDSTNRSTIGRANRRPMPGRPAATDSPKSCARSSRIIRACRSSRSPTFSMRRCLRDAVPRRPSGQSDRTPAAGARSSRGDSRRGASRGRRHRGAADRRAPCRGVFERRTRPALIRISCRTAATRWR